MTCSDALLMLDSTPQTADSRHTQVGGPAPCHADDRPNARTGRTAKTHTRTVLRHNDVHDRKQRQSPESLGRWHVTADQPFGREAAPGPEACKTWSSGSSVVAGLRSRTRTGVRLGARLTATHGGAACGGRQLPRHTIRDTGAAEADTCRSTKGPASPRPYRHDRQSGHARRQRKPGSLLPSVHSWNSEPKLGNLVSGKEAVGYRPGHC